MILPHRANPWGCDFRERQRVRSRNDMGRSGYKLANDGHDTRALQHYMGHKNIMHTVRYTEMAPDRFKNFWKD
jgi:integrase-like protein